MVMTENTRAGEHTVRLKRSVVNTSNCSFVNSGVWWFPILLHEIPSFSLTLFRMVLPAYKATDFKLTVFLQLYFTLPYLQSWGGMYSGLLSRHPLKIVGSFFFFNLIQIINKLPSYHSVKCQYVVFVELWSSVVFFWKITDGSVPVIMPDDPHKDSWMLKSHKHGFCQGRKLNWKLNFDE